MNIERLFDACSAFSEKKQRLEKIKNLQHRIFESNRKICGNCDHNMKTTCPRHSKCGGNSVATSTPENSWPACGEFLLCEWLCKLIGEWEKEISLLYKQIEVEQ